jgi:hypothetical protein
MALDVSIGIDPTTRIKYTAGGAGAESFLTITFPPQDGVFELTLAILAYNASDSVEFNRTLYLRRAAGVWSSLQTLVLPGLAASIGAASWVFAIGAIVGSTITLTGTSAAGVSWVTTIEMVQRDA